MITAGIDLAAEAAKSALAVVRWHDDGHAEVEQLTLGASDELIAGTIGRVDKAGVDCPFGWPSAFVSLVADHHRHALEPPRTTGRQWRSTLDWRRTDHLVHERTGARPLSVSADRIAQAAFRWAGISARLEHRVDCRRDGSGAVAEVYPAAALRVWGLAHSGYKTARHEAARDRLVEALVGNPAWLLLGPHADLCRASDDALDAVICAVVARAVAVGDTTWPVTEAERIDALTEGWIHVPAGAMSALRTCG